MSVPYSDRDGSEAPKTLEGNEPETTQGASGSPSNPSDSSDVLRRVTEARVERYADAIYTTHRAAVGVLRADLIARTVMAVADAEQEALRAALDERNRLWGHRSRELGDLRAEVEDWRDKAQEAGAAYANANSKHHAEWDRANRLERLADTLAGKAVDLEDRARAAEADRDELRAEVERLRATGLRHIDYFKAMRERAEKADKRAEAAEAIVERVRALHHVTEMDAITGDCAAESCDHEDECPMSPVAVCAACWDFANGIDSYYGENGIADILWPCPTAAILAGAQTPQTTRQSRDVAPGAPGSAPGSASGGTETGEALEGAQGGEEREAGAISLLVCECCRPECDCGCVEDCPAPACRAALEGGER